jgi:hypothetical protein
MGHRHLFYFDTTDAWLFKAERYVGLFNIPKPPQLSEVLSDGIVQQGGLRR